MSNYYNTETLLEQQAEIEKLKAERDALAAQVEALRSIGQRLWDSPEPDTRQKIEAEADIWLELKDALAATPQQHLAERDAQKVRDGFVAGFKRRTALGPLRKMWSEEEIIELYNQYADSIRQEK